MQKNKAVHINILLNPVISFVLNHWEEDFGGEEITIAPDLAITIKAKPFNKNETEGVRVTVQVIPLSFSAILVLIEALNKQTNKKKQLAIKAEIADVKNLLLMRAVTVKVTELISGLSELITQYCE